MFLASLSLLSYLLFFFFFVAKTAAPTPATPAAPIATARGEETLTSYSEEKPSAEVAITVTVPPFNAVKTPFSSIDAISGLLTLQVISG